MSLSRKIPPLFKLHTITFSRAGCKFVSTRPLGCGKVKIPLYISITSDICVNGLYTIAFKDVGSLETNFSNLFVLGLVLLAVSFSPLLLDPGPFTSLLNGARQFRREENVLAPPDNLRAKWELIIKISQWLSFVYNFVGSACLVALTLLAPEMPPVLGSITTFKDHKDVSVVMKYGSTLIQVWFMISVTVTLSFLFMIALFLPLHCVVERLSFLKRLFDHLGNFLFPFASALAAVSILLLGTFPGFANKWSKQRGTKFGKKWPLINNSRGFKVYSTSPGLDE
ncbi:hypothetical protein Fcan01_27409 [Folsomia candida]|uniref:Uncharacterized protein n=1 Tax=Folsomia candida TaxID=158441 RepID=A0A226CWY8_FOLCA|nr:hypothetical protein Fcan01_27409 [Folsomia candida]